MRTHSWGPAAIQTGESLGGAPSPLNVAYARAEKSAVRWLLWPSGTFYGTGYSLGKCWHEWPSTQQGAVQSLCLQMGKESEKGGSIKKLEKMFLRKVQQEKGFRHEENYLTPVWKSISNALKRAAMPKVSAFKILLLEESTTQKRVDFKSNTPMWMYDCQ